MSFNERAVATGKALSSSVIQYPSFTKALELISNAIEIGNGTGVFTGVRVMAPSGCGKTLLVKCLKNNTFNLDMLSHELSVITADLKEAPSVSQIQGGLLDNFKYGLTSRRASNNNEVHRVLVSAMAEHNVRLIVLDEFQHVFSPNGDKVSTQVIDWLKRLMNITQVPVVLVGTEQMDRLGAVDPQLTTRIPTTIKLLPFQHNAEWVGFLKAFARECSAVDISIIYEPQLALQLFRVTNGVLRPLKTLIVQAVAMAVNDDEERLTRKGLYAAYRMIYGPEVSMENPFDVF